MDASFSYEAAVQELQRLLQQLQQGGGALETHLEAHRRGAELIRQCRAYLDEAELEVKKVTLEGGLRVETNWDAE